MEATVYKDWISSIFNGAAPRYGRGVSSFFDYFAQRLVQFSPSAPGSSVLDVATGSGTIIKYIESASKVVGIDISSEMINQAKATIFHADFHVMDAERLTFDPGSFDHLYCGFALSFFPSLQVALSEFSRVLKPGGQMAVSIWRSDTNHAHITFNQGMKQFNFPSTHVQPFHQLDSVVQSIIESGFEEIEIESAQKMHIYPSIDLWFDSLWAQASRGHLERLTGDQLVDFKAKMVEWLTPTLKSDGLHAHLSCFFVKARKPS